jgi:adenylosuccinate synthase
MNIRKNSIAFCGGAYGDEGKGRIVDEYVYNFAKKDSVVVYRDNGGANAGHTVEFADGTRVALHQLPSGIFCKNATVILGKGMVIHPGDLLMEIAEVKKAVGTIQFAKLYIDEMAVLSLNTHRAFESTLKMWQEGGKGATGRGIAPAYADIILRHPIRVRDLKPFSEDIVVKHYKLYEALLSGLGVKLSTVLVPVLNNTKPVEVGNLKYFIQNLKKNAVELAEYIEDVSLFVKKSWSDKNISYVFEKAQAVGLDARWGVYPDVTASDTTFDGILSSTEGIIDALEIEKRAAVIKATYMSSVGSRILPTTMENSLAEKIREDAHEYGATTKRPRGIAYIDIPALKFFVRVGGANCLVLTHMDIVYPKTPIKVCIEYRKNGKKIDFRPDQKFLLGVKPVYKNLKSWDRKALEKAKSYTQLPIEAKEYLHFLEKEIGVKILMVTTGAKRGQSLFINKKI